MSTVPGKQCQGYPLGPYPSDIDEISFYLPVEKNKNNKHDAEKSKNPFSTFFWSVFTSATNNTNDSNDVTRLACSMILAPGSSGSESQQNTISSFPKNIIDSLGSCKDVVIVCHGFLSWRNQMLINHAAAGISKANNCHTLRFDFSGNGHSDGVWRYGNYDVELNDLKQVVRFVRDTLKCRVSCLLGHSKGTGIILNYAAWEQQQKQENPSAVGGTVPCLVNLAGKFSVPTTIDPILSKFTAEQQNEMRQNNKFELMKRGERILEVTRDELLLRANQDTKNVISSIMDAPTFAMLTIHGEADESIPVDHARQFDASGIPNHELVIIEGADHNFNGLRHMKTITSAISEFLNRHVEA